MKILLITGKNSGHNLFPLKECLEDTGAEVNIALTLEQGKKEFFQYAKQYGTVVVAKEPTIVPGDQCATMQRVVQVIQSFTAHNHNLRQAIVSLDFEDWQKEELASKGINYFYAKPLEPIVEFCNQKAPG